MASAAEYATTLSTAPSTAAGFYHPAKGFGSPAMSPIPMKTNTSLAFDGLITSTSVNHRNASTINGALSLQFLPARTVSQFDGGNL